MLDFSVQRVEEFYRATSLSLEKPNVTYFVEKFSPFDYFLNIMHEIYPRGKELILVRDFRDTIASILSYTRRKNISGFSLSGAANEIEYVSRFGKSAEALLRAWKRRSSSSYLVRYEDLIDDMENSVLQILGFLGVSNNPEIVTGVVQNALANDAAAQLGHQTSRDPKASIGRWQTEMSVPMQEACNRLLRDPLIEFGYTV